MKSNLAKIISDTLGLPEEAITDATSSENTPEWDSVAHLNIVMSIEQAYGLQFTPEEFMQMTSIPAMERLLQARGAV